MDTTLTYIGGPTALIECGGLRILTDPTFDAAGSEYTTPVYTLHKTTGPAIDRAHLGAVDIALISHDHHFDNLDRAGKEAVAAIPLVLTTVAGAERLGANARGLRPWESHEVLARGGPTLHITATPARHGPAGSDRGPVIGFVLDRHGGSWPCIYISGDTVLYDELEQVSRRFTPDIAVLFMGAARVAEVGPAHLTFTAEEAVEAAKTIFPDALIVPLHFEGWKHFSESRSDIEAAFAKAGLTHRLRFPVAGAPMRLEAD
jgi:L-ascorbate metabolism protein UlaG (beta-lactamase superfamily)